MRAMRRRNFAACIWASVCGCFATKSLADTAPTSAAEFLPDAEPSRVTTYGYGYDGQTEPGQLVSTQEWYDDQGRLIHMAYQYTA